MRQNKNLLFTQLETWGVAFVALVVLLAGDARDLLQHYGLIQSSQLVQDHLHQSVGSSLHKLDSFQQTNSVVTFMLWGMVGLVIFGFVHALLRASGRLSDAQDVSSDAYVHPAGFNRTRFWQRILLDTLLSFVLLLAFVAGAVLYAMAVLPLGWMYSRRFLLQASFSRVGDLLAGLLIIFLGTYILYGLAKLLLWQHRRTAA